MFLQGDELDEKMATISILHISSAHIGICSRHLRRKSYDKAMRCSLSFSPVSIIQCLLQVHQAFDYTLLKMAILAPPGTSQTLILMWVLSMLSITVMALRLVMRKIRGHNFDVGDYVTMGAIFCLVTQISLIHVVLIWGTNNVTEAYRSSHHSTDQEIYQREVGSKLIFDSKPSPY
jgi:cobalamin synthase